MRLHVHARCAYSFTVLVDLQKGLTALHVACWVGCLKVVELLLAKGADINARDQVVI